VIWDNTRYAVATVSMASRRSFCQQPSLFQFAEL